jgi:hypothetical protein
MMAARFDRGGALIDGAIDRDKGSIASTFGRGGALIDGAIDRDRGAIASTFDRSGALINHTIGGGLGQTASVLGSSVQASRQHDPGQHCCCGNFYMVLDESVSHLISQLIFILWSVNRSDS